MKRITGIILSLLLILSVIPLSFVAVADGEPTYDMTVYVSNSGNDGTGDGSQANPYASIATAEGVIEAASASNGRIVMLTDMNFTSAPHTKMITITGSTGSENLTHTDAVISVNGPTTFKGFCINNTINHASNGNEVIYEDITFDNSRGIFYFGNIDSSVTTPNNITLNGLGKATGKGADIRIGPHMSGGSASTNATNGTINSDINIVMNSGYYHQFWMLNGTYNGDLNVTINGGTMYSGCQFDFYGVNKSTYNGAFQLLLNNGFSTSNVYVSEVEKINAANGSWFMYCDNTGGALSTTATPGTFTVSPGFQATATNASTGTEYTSLYGTLTVPAGKYSVTYSFTGSDSAVYYVSSSGSDSNNGLTDSTPFATISRAEAAIEATGAQSGEIIMLTDMTFTSAPHTKMITITGSTGAENLSQTGTTTSANGPTTFSNFSVNDTFKNITDGNEVIYENITVSGTKGMFYFGNSDSSITTPNNITVDGLGSGVNNGVNVRIGPGTRQGIVNSDLNVVINRGYFNQFWVHEGTYNGNVSFTFNGGVVYGSDPFLDPYTNYTTTYNGAYQVILNNNFSQSISPSVNTITAAGGKWLMYGDNTGGALTTTATPGTFSVKDGYTATATDRSSGIEYTSVDGTLTVPAGTYDVTYEIIILETITLYVSSSGNDDTGNGTSGSPYATIAKAEQMIEAASVGAGEIVMLTDMTFTSATHTKMITIKGNTGGENLTRTGSVISVGGPTTFKDFCINDTINHVTDGNEVIYRNITFDNSRGIFYLGNSDSSITTPNNITIDGLGKDNWKGANLRIGPRTRGGVMNSDLNIVVIDGYFNQFWVHEGTYNGNVSYTINGGTVYGGDPFIDPYAINNHVYNGAYQVILNNGISSSAISPTVKANVTAAGGKWLMYCDNSGGTLSTTATPGTFNVNGSPSAIATNLSTDAVYSSVDGVLVVPAGEYSVSFGYAVNNTATFYVSENGNDANDGLTAGTAFATIDRAEKWLGYSTAENKTIIVSGEVDFDGGEPHDDMITIKGDGTASIAYKSSGYNSVIYSYLELMGPTTFENITLPDIETTRFIVTNGQELVFGEGVGEGSAKYYIGNLDNSSTSSKAENVTVNSWAGNAEKGAMLDIGTYGGSSTDNTMGDLNLTINGGTIRRIWFNKAVINGNVNIIWNGGNLTTLEGSEYSTRINENTVFNGAIQFIMNNGKGAEVLGDAFTSVTAADGVWYVYCNETAGGYLTTTDYPGFYKVNGAEYAKATCRETGEVFYSYDGELDLEGYDGTFDVEFYDSIHFGDVNYDGVLDICDLIAEKKAIISYAGNGSYSWVADIDEDLAISSLDYKAIVKHLLGQVEIVWESNENALISAADLTFGGAESAAASKKSTISSNSDTVKSASGTKYYVSPNGNDSNSGTSSSAPLKTIAGLNAKSLGSGNIVLFERGSVYRTDVALDVVSGVKYGAYGSGAKPVISGSLKNYAEGTTWTTEDGRIWQTSIGKDDVGNIVFNDGAFYGYRKFDRSKLINDGDYYYDLTGKVLYLFLDQYNPSSYFDSIEISTTPRLVNKQSASSVTLENIVFTYSAIHGVVLTDCSNVQITGCEFKWIGGALDGEGTRYGNAIEFWNAIDENGIGSSTVSKCHFYQIYDAAITCQGNTINDYRNLTVENNLIEYSSYNFELWCSKKTDIAKMMNISVTNNVFRYAGYGFGKQRSATYSQAYILSYDFDPDNIATFSSVTISNNIFDCAKSYFFNAKNAIDDIIFSNNTYYQKSGSNYPVVRGTGDVSNDIVPKNQAEFAAEIAKVEASPALVSWIE